MRIISGKYKGRFIPAPKGMKARPTTDYAKSALFNILEHKIDFTELRVLDLFCGTGGISFEFLSRGAKEVIAVDSDYQSTEFCNKFARELGYQNQYRAYKNDCLRALKQLTGQFDLVFCDPPYTYEDHAKLANAVTESVLAPGGLMIMEHGFKTNLETQPFYTETRKYGNIYFSFFNKPSE
ncbi:MAG TPA: 16S rRNA (guanine(966)-N(2))-methyltransferase RsmD [Flavobacteriales bacterium]|nr:16S rRNA (guanine(966)-N(2))-methyltransferase RsmD [Flavobacteriales bacterium]